MQAHSSLFEIFVIPLNKSQIKYMTTGSVASIMYGEPRLTHDIDFVIFLTEKDIDQLYTLFPQDHFYVPPKEVIRLELARDSRGHFNIIHSDTAFKADIYLMGNDPIQTWGFKKRRKLQLNDSYIYLAPPEYVIVKKLAYWEEGKHEKHLRDIKAMIQIQGDDISIDEIRSHLSSAIQRKEFDKIIDNL